MSEDYKRPKQQSANFCPNQPKYMPGKFSESLIKTSRVQKGVDRMSSNITSSCIACLSMKMR